MPLTSQQYANLADHSYGRNLDGSMVDLKALIQKRGHYRGCHIQSSRSR